MKGIIFSELVGFLDQTGGPVFAEEVLAKAALEHGGAFTRVGRYPYQEALRMIDTASRMTGAAPADLCYQFGFYLFGRFTIFYADIIGRYNDAETLLMHVDDHIHEEVVMLTPDAKPPKVTASRQDGVLRIEYASHRPFAHIAHGLVAGAMEHFGDERVLEWVYASDDDRRASFALTD